LIERSIARLLPTLGICFGAQLVARALGARVYPVPARELGWKPLLLTQEGKSSAIAQLAPEAASLLHWHADSFDLPPQATLLASHSRCATPDFRVGRSRHRFSVPP
jgi:GMP synthase (glutamine-hydrolysing)